MAVQHEHMIKWDGCEEASNIYYNSKRIITETPFNEFYIGYKASTGHYEVSCVKNGNESKKASIYIEPPTPADSLRMIEQ